MSKSGFACRAGSSRAIVPLLPLLRRVVRGRPVRVKTGFTEHRARLIARLEGGGYVIDNTNRRQILYADHLALCCTGPRCWLCNHCNSKIHAQADEFDDDGLVSLYEREHANINNNHVF
mgnify:CR=1 FL=1